MFDSCIKQNDGALRKSFESPGNEFRPVPFWHINGNMTTEGIIERVTNAKNRSGFGGVAILPVSATTPTYLTCDYFARYADILNVSEKLGTEVIFYDDINFPSGSAGGRLQKEYPRYTRKHLEKDEILVNGPRKITQSCPDTTTHILMAVSAMNTKTLQIVDLKNYLQNNQLRWDVPEGEWRIMIFSCKLNVQNLVDYMQPKAVDKFIELTYDEFAKRFSRFFGNVITKTFYDDVGFVHQEETWTPAITEIFEKKYGKNPALYYPALYYNIGPETGAARVAFYDIRSELMAEGYVRKVGEWSAQHRLKSMGHPPENYSANTTVANGDILKYYRHTQIPLMDNIFFHGRGIHGFKQVSSAADLGDKPIVGAEIYGAFPANTDSLMLYRVAMEVMARGINFIVPHGMWYDTAPEKIHIPPLISFENPLLGKSLPRYSEYVARSCMMLQGGTRVSDIALLWPINAIQAESYINRDKEATSPNRVEALEKTIIPRANWVPPHVNHHLLSNLLSNTLRRDFTFIHPEDLHNGTITAVGQLLELNNAENKQRYKVLVMPGGEVISAETLKAIRDYYKGGGKIIATELLPIKSAEFDRDEEVKSLVREIFGNVSGNDTIVTNSNGGMAAYTGTTEAGKLQELFSQMNLASDVSIDATIANDGGYVNYIHKKKDNLEIYFLTNSSNQSISAEIHLRGKLKPEWWNPYTGETHSIDEYHHVLNKQKEYETVFQFSLPKVYSAFIVGAKE